MSLCYKERGTKGLVLMDALRGVEGGGSAPLTWPASFYIDLFRSISS